MTAAAGGYVESSYITGKSLSDYGNVTRSATFVLRVPAAGLDAYVEALSGSFNVLSRQESAEDITDSYYDSKARLDSLLVQEKRLLSMLEGADDLEYMLKLEDKLSEVRYQIESLYSTLQRYDKAVEMATVNVSLREVVEYQRITEPPKTFGERLHQSFPNRNDLQTAHRIYSVVCICISHTACDSRCHSNSCADCKRYFTPAQAAQIRGRRSDIGAGQKPR